MVPDSGVPSAGLSMLRSLAVELKSRSVTPPIFASLTNIATVAAETVTVCGRAHRSKCAL